MPIRTSVAQDILEFAPTMRKADVEEVRSIAGLDPLEALSVGLFTSKPCMTGVDEDGEIVMLFGIVPGSDNIGYVWMLSTDAIAQNKRELIREGKRWLDEQSALYRVLTNVVDKRNVVHQRLIKHMGFQFGDPIDNYGVERISVLPFER